jgi:hypothetical protein
MNTKKAEKIVIAIVIGAAANFAGAADKKIDYVPKYNFNQTHKVELPKTAPPQVQQKLPLNAKLDNGLYIPVTKSGNTGVVLDKGAGSGISGQVGVRVYTK